MRNNIIFIFLKKLKNIKIILYKYSINNIELQQTYLTQVPKCLKYRRE